MEDSADGNLRTYQYLENCEGLFELCQVKSFTRSSNFDELRSQLDGGIFKFVFICKREKSVRK